MNKRAKYPGFQNAIPGRNMASLSRRKFIYSLSLAAASLGFRIPDEKIKLSFSTLGCPDWSFEKIVAFAVKYGYSALEIRGVQRELDLTKALPFNSPEKIKATVQLLADNNLSLIDLGSSAALHFAHPVTRKKHLDDARRFIDLAAATKCPFVRVFPNVFPKEQDRSKTMDLMVAGMRELGDYAKSSGVTVLLETHGELLYAEDISKVMTAVDHPQTGIIWDLVNMWSVTGEAPEDVYPVIRNWIRHTHIKDISMANGKPVDVFVGEGISPTIKQLEILKKNNYNGYYGFEWEKLWHPEIPEPEIAFAAYADFMKKWYSGG